MLSKSLEEDRPMFISVPSPRPESPESILDALNVCSMFPESLVSA